LSWLSGPHRLLNTRLSFVMARAGAHGAMFTFVALWTGAFWASRLGAVVVVGRRLTSS